VPGGRHLTDGAVAVGFVDVEGVERRELLEDCAQELFEGHCHVGERGSLRGCG
jgi:hypothetical protein